MPESEMKKKPTTIKEHALAMGRAIAQISKELYFIFSVEVLKRRLGIENSTYMKWHDQRAKRTQMLLDMEHGTNFSGAY